MWYLDKFTKENKGDPISANINTVRITPKRYSISFSSSIVEYPHSTPVNNVALVNIDNSGFYKYIIVIIFRQT